MMKFILMMMFMIPLMVLKSKYWLNQFIYFIITFVFFLNMKFSSIMSEISYLFMCDLLSYFMILLSFWICSLMIMASEKIFKEKNNLIYFNFMILILLLSLILTFSSFNLFIFYLFFEMSMIPVLIIIMGWGFQPERIQAGNYLFFYTMFGSLPMMIFIITYYNLNNSLIMYMMINNSNIMMFLFSNLVFFIKMPMYMIHLWLPKAHVEAPVAGSMILAGVMLKLGGYGMLRLMPIFLEINNKFNYIIIVISLYGGFLVSLICLRQSDMKLLVAYSSIAHMSLVLSSIMTYSIWGLTGGFIMMISHGLCSSGMFCLVNICYERLKSRSLFLNKGLMSLMPSMSLWWFLICSSNMAAPPSLNLLSEVMMINSLVNWSFYLIILIMMISFFSAAYSLFLYSFSQHGKIYLGIYSILLNNFREFMLLMLHWLPLNIMIFKSDMFMLWN